MIQKPKGTLDLINSEAEKFLNIEYFVHEFMNIYNYNYIKVPTFEVSELFKRGVGDSTDIVNKETYDFLDKGERNMTLRPEFTAGIVRSFIENKEYVSNKLKKYYYFGSCFRYERPQNGRLREFTQFGVEVFGVKNPRLDVDVINTAYKFLDNLGIKNLKLKINTLGDSESREKYKEVLLKYLEQDKENLCDICKERLKRNPLRILDCKYDGDREFILNAPKTIDYLNEDSIEYFEEVKRGLEVLDIKYEVDTNLVRGLDYYSHTVFEIVIDSEDLNKAGTLCGGGRYDKLVELLDGPSTPGVGFAMGVERIMNVLDKENEHHLDVYIMNLTKDDLAYKIQNELRECGYKTELDYMNKNMKNQWKLVEDLNPYFVIIIGEDEINGDYLTIKDNLTKDQTQVKKDDLIEFLNTYY